ncbi:MFS transporter [Terrihabitans rhizophilus]|uniref:MFS transporter n=1 Tax=Terrihabitans rhizophilus TaxID=3092662 RepID=A0ABU4RTJ7_9HYPH|nr:MFS transporter [Terrihabitans sp. PJ23]MDX6806955.1 MFS transporter [Terrihabitans sp. PJ23]
MMPTPEAAPLPSHQASASRLVAAVVASAYFMLNLDGTVIVTALPSMAADYGVSEIAMGLGITAYLMALAAFVPLGGWLGERLGARKVLAAAMLAFSATSLLCAFAPSLGLFVLARVLQGLAGALIFPVGRLAVLRNTPNSGMLQAISTITWPALIAPVIGPVVGGALADWAGWPWIFLLNLPVGVAGGVLVLIFVPGEDRAPARPFDMRGLALTSCSLLLLVYMLDALSQRQGALLSAALAGTASLLLGVAALRHLKRAPHPLIGLQPLHDRVFSLTSLGAGTLCRAAINAAPFLLPLMFQLGFGLSSVEAGSLVLVYFAGNLAMKSVTTRILRRLGFRTVLLANGMLAAASLYALGFVDRETPYPALAAVLFTAGMFRSLQFTALNTLAFVNITQADRASATTLWSMGQQVANCLGFALSGVALTVSMSLRGENSLSLADFQIAFLAAAMLAGGAVCRFALLDPAAGDDIAKAP